MQTVWTQSDPTKCWAGSEFKFFDTDAIPERICFKRSVVLKKNEQMTKTCKIIKQDKTLAIIYNRQEKVRCMVNTSLEPSSDLILSHQTHILTVKAFPVQFHHSF